MISKKRKLKLKVLISSIFVFTILCWGQVYGQFATLVELRHKCGFTGGYVEFELNGDPDFYTYYWEHGPETLILDRLLPGIYTLVVRDFYGCEERYEVEILALESCVMNYQFTYTLDPCIGLITIQVFSSGGNLIDESALNIVWQDGDPSGLNRLVNLGYSGNYCVEITLIGDNGSCCYINECIPVAASPSCGDRCDRRLIVNETNRNPDGKGQFVELLVVGGCDCENTTDLRGYILDDNNGLLIPGNEFVNFYNVEESIGVNPGYLVFFYSENWESVPNGSLIVIYDQRDGSIPELPLDDPSDADQDGVYVLQASDSNYFFAKSGTWNENDNVLNYYGTLSTAEWERINISSLADGIQVRQPDGTFHHGVSLGVTQFSSANNFPLWITSNFSGSHNIQLTGSDFSNKTDFTFSDAQLALRTPGLPNSPENALLRDTLRDCNFLPPFLSGSNIKSRDGKEEAAYENDLIPQSIIAYPNPFTEEINIAFNSNLNGISELKVLTVSGKSVLQKKIRTKRGENLFTLPVDSGYPSGLIFLEFTFPSGEKQSLKVTHIQAR